MRRYGAAYRRRHGDRIPPQHLRAMEAIETCRTEAQGGHVYECAHCGATVFSYHSCKNRSCPGCQQHETESWLRERTEQLVPRPYFLITFTVPSSLRGLARRNQKTFYSALLRAAAESLQTLADDPRHLGGRLGMIAVLHTWTKKLNYHPHVHILAPGVGVSPDGDGWASSPYKDFLVPVRALSIIFRAKTAAALNKAGLLDQTPRGIWKKPWVVHCKAVGDGKPALIYLASYIRRTAISNSRIKSVDNGKVVLTCRESDSDHDPQAGPAKHVELTLDADEFIRRFLQHTLPHSFVKVRYYGFLSPTWRKKFAELRPLLGEEPMRRSDPDKADSATGTISERDALEPPIVRCPYCGYPLKLRETIARKKRGPP